MFVTNLAPCSGVRLHLWHEKTKKVSANELPVSRRVVEVTTKMVHIPAGPAPRQVPILLHLLLILFKFTIYWFQK